MPSLASAVLLSVGIALPEVIHELLYLVLTKDVRSCKGRPKDSPGRRVGSRSEGAARQTYVLDRNHHGYIRPFSRLSCMTPASEVLAQLHDTSFRGPVSMDFVHYSGPQELTQAQNTSVARSATVPSNEFWQVKTRAAFAALTRGYYLIKWKCPPRA